MIPNERLLFGDFLEPNAERRVYRMVHDLPAMEATVTDYLQVRRSQLRCSSAYANPSHVPRLKGSGLKLGLGLTLGCRMRVLPRVQGRYVRRRPAFAPTRAMGLG